MYPKVKVRSLEEDDHPKVPLRGFSSLAIRNSNPPGAKESKQASSLSVAKVPKLHIPRSVTPPIVLPKAQKKSELDSDDTCRIHIRASSIPRPRAVISSPDNDQLLGTSNRGRIERPAGLKSRNLSKGTHTHSEGISGPTSIGRNPLKRVGENKESGRTSDDEAKKEHTFHIRVPRANIVKAKPCFSVT